MCLPICSKGLLPILIQIQGKTCHNSIFSFKYDPLLEFLQSVLYFTSTYLVLIFVNICISPKHQTVFFYLTRLVFDIYKIITRELRNHIPLSCPNTLNIAYECNDNISQTLQVILQANTCHQKRNIFSRGNNYI